jgi:hypothetical protein
MWFKENYYGYCISLPFKATVYDMVKSYNFNVRSKTKV